MMDVPSPISSNRSCKWPRYRERITRDFSLSIEKIIGFLTKRDSAIAVPKLAHRDCASGSLDSIFCGAIRLMDAKCMKDLESDSHNFTRMLPDAYLEIDAL